MSARLDEVIVESGEFLKCQSSSVQAAYYGSAACSSEVDCKIIFLLFHFFSFRYKFR